MKKRISLLICLALISSLTVGGICGCSSDRAGQNRPAGVNDVLQQGMAEEDSKNDADGQSAESGTANEPQSTDDTQTQEPEQTADTASEPEAPSDGEVPSDGIDVDLTILSSTMVYSEVYNMMTSPEDYIGKSIKMDGLFSVYYDEDSGNYYYACVIQDATACCAQGIEFVLTDDYTYPDDYPDVDEEICVYGIFDTYQEGEYTYCTLRNARLL